MRIEWRSRTEGDDALLAVEPSSNMVVDAWAANVAILADFLNEMVAIKPHAGNGAAIRQPEPEQWGDLVIARSDEGDVLEIDPELYWAGVAYWFRAHGDDPHRWHPRGQ